MNRRNFLKYAFLGSANLVMLSYPFDAKASHEFLEEKARSEAAPFIDKIHKVPLRKLNKAKLVYDVHLSRGSAELGVEAVLEMQESGNGYYASFNLANSRGENLIGKIALFFGAMLQLDQYKEWVESIETRLDEHFELGSKRFMTKDLEEIVNIKKYKNHTPVKIEFDYEAGSIHFWKNKYSDTITDSLPYTDQEGPLTGFFNFLFFDENATSKNIINVLKQVADSEAQKTGVPDAEKIKDVDYLFESQTAELGDNITGKYPEYENTVSFAKMNFLDIIYGQHIYYQLLQNNGDRLKVPYSVFVEGLISKKNKREKMKGLNQRYSKKEDIERALIREADDILGARNIRVYLKRFELAFN